ncbi:MAG: hypothetical protein AAGI07_10650 [Bacteroidota bacterium]
MQKRYKAFLLIEVPVLIKKLKKDSLPLWDIIDSQQMPEHLVYVTNTTMRRDGTPDTSFVTHHKNMKLFIESNRKFPRNVNPKNIQLLSKKLKHSSIEKTKAQVSDILEKLYDFYEKNPHFKCYNAHLGELDFQLCERFHYKHYQHHL